MVEAWKRGRVCRRVICRGAADDSTERDAAVVRQHQKRSGSGETVGQQSMIDSGVQGSGSEDEQVAGKEQAAVETKAGGTRGDVQQMNKGGSGVRQGRIGVNGQG
jgi:hypothetical protein